MPAVVFKVEERFEGPLDLLLFLVSKNKVDIFDIPVALILDQYMEHLDRMKSFDIEIAAEFVEMASRLVRIKSRLLLPKDPDEQAEDPRMELAEALAEYKQFREISDVMQRMYEVGCDVAIKRPEPLGYDLPLADHTVSQLVKAIGRMLERREGQRPPDRERFSRIVGREVARVSDRIQAILSMLKRGQGISLTEVFDCADSRTEAVASLLAVLELYKDGVVVIEELDEDCFLKLTGEEYTQVDEYEY